MVIVNTPRRRELPAPPSGRKLPLDKAVNELRDFRRMEVTFEKRHGLSLQQASILEIVDRQTAGGVRPSVGMIVKEDRNSWNVVARCIRVLVNKGLVQRTYTPEDVRVHLIELTPAGSDLLERIRAADAHL